MRMNVLVTGGAYSSQAGYSALQFCRAAVKAGHVISQVFFYQDGVTQASALAVPLADEYDANESWVDFANSEQVALAVCVSAGERRGVIGEEQAKEFAKAGSSLHPEITVVGLGALHEASLSADRTVTFK